MTYFRVHYSVQFTGYILNGANLGANGANLDAKEEALYERLLDIVEKDPHITQNKLSEDLDTSRRTVQRVMDELKSQGSLERIGGTRGYWKVIRQ